jgi:4-amino-4-deoxy-L-arabinose transferase-like glycosyltransferase
MTAIALWGMSRRLIQPTESARFAGWHLALIVPLVLAVVFVVVFPWLYLIQNRAPGFLTTSIGHDVIDRARSGHEGHSWPPGYYTLAAWGTYFPWSLLIPAAVANAWQRRREPLTRFALAAWIGPWVMFELVAGKLPHYVLPTYPAIAYLVADMLLRASRGAFADLKRRDFRIAVWIWAGIVSLIGLGAWAGLVVAGQFDVVQMIVATAIAAVAIVMGLMTAIRFSAGRTFAAARVMGIGMIVLVAMAYSLYLPHYQPLRISAQLAKIMRDNGGYGAQGYMIDYKEPSLAFHQGGGLREQSDDSYLNDAPQSDWPQWVVLTRRVWDATRDDVRGQWRVIGSVRGLAYNEGGKREVLVLRRAVVEPGQIVAP